MPTRKSVSLSFFLYPILIGFLAAMGAILFRGLIEIFQFLFWSSPGDLLTTVQSAPWWLKLAVPTTAGLIVGPVIVYLVPEARGPGVPEVILSVANRLSTMRHRVTLLKALVTSLLIGAGASVGREGPIVQIGASVGSSLAQLFRLGPEMRRLCLACGAAAGISATFNAPIAGTFFAVEIILMDVEIASICHIILASIVASVLSRLFWGEFQTFALSSFALNSYWELILYVALGVIAGLVAIVFIRSVYGADTLFRRVRLPEWIKPGLGGLLLGVMALKLPQVLGVGYETINATLAGEIALASALVLVAGKLAATSLCIGSGMSGGIFAPSLFVGAALGTAFGLLSQTFLPHLGIAPAHYALAGMGALVSGTTLAPITAVLTVFELTYTPQVILPLMAACLTSTIVVRMLFGYSIYEMKLLKQGINIVRGHDVGVLRSLKVDDFMDTDFPRLSASIKLDALLEEVMHSPYPHFVVLDADGRLAGMLSLRDIREPLVRYDRTDKSLTAADFMSREVVSIDPDDTLEYALDLFEGKGISCIPVLHRFRNKRVVGILKKDDLLHAYKERVLKDRILSLPIR